MTQIHNINKLDYTRGARVAPLGLCVENVQESEIGDVSATSDGSDSLQNGKKYNIMRVLRTSYVLFFAQNQIFHLKWFANMEVIFYEKTRFFWDPLFVPFLLNLSFEDH